MAEVCDAFGVALTEFNAKHDHVHLPIHDPRPTTVEPSILAPASRVSRHGIRDSNFPRPHPGKPLQSLFATIVFRCLRRRDPAIKRRPIHHQPETALIPGESCSPGSTTQL
ncbi:hypothetical protein [Rhodococcus jostii]